MAFDRLLQITVNALSTVDDEPLTMLVAGATNARKTAVAPAGGPYPHLWFIYPVEEVFPSGDVVGFYRTIWDWRSQVKIHPQAEVRGGVGPGRQFRYRFRNEGEHTERSVISSRAYTWSSWGSEARFASADDNGMGRGGSALASRRVLRRASGGNIFYDPAFMYFRDWSEGGGDLRGELETFVQVEFVLSRVWAERQPQRFADIARSDRYSVGDSAVFRMRIGVGGVGAELVDSVGWHVQDLQTVGRPTYRVEGRQYDGRRRYVEIYCRRA